MDLLAGFKNISGGSVSKKITEVWRLIDETALLLNHTAIRDRFSRQLMVLRAQLQRAQANPAVCQEVYAAVTELRKKLRLAGYDLSMGKYTLIFDGFRNDDAMGSGFCRMVLFMGEDVFYWKTGDENHVMLSSYLESQLEKSPKFIPIKERHYLWYMRTRTSLTLSGGATETAEDYEKLKAAGEADSLFFLSRLKGLG